VPCYSVLVLLKPQAYRANTLPLGHCGSGLQKEPGLLWTELSKVGTGHNVCLGRKNATQNRFNLQKMMFYHIHRLSSKPGNSFIFNCSCSPGYNCLEDWISLENIAFIICISISLRNSDLSLSWVCWSFSFCCDWMSFTANSLVLLVNGWDINRIWDWTTTCIGLFPNLANSSSEIPDLMQYCYFIVFFHYTSLVQRCFIYWEVL